MLQETGETVDADADADGNRRRRPVTPADRAANPRRRSRTWQGSLLRINHAMRRLRQALGGVVDHEDDDTA